MTLTADRSRRDRPLHDLPLLVTDRADRHHRNLQQHFSDRDDGRNGEGTSHSRGNKGNLPAYQIIKAMTPPKRITKKNESCDPASATLVCPDSNSDNTKQPLDQKFNKKFGMDPKSPSLNISRLCEYLSIDPTNIGTRFNW